MTTISMASATVACATLLLVAACTSEDAATAEPSTLSAAVESPVCATGDGVGTDLPEWPYGGRTDAEFLPVVMSSVVSVGPNRFLYNVLDPAYRQLAAPDVPSSIDFYALERDPESPVASVDAAFLASGLGRGLYRAAVDFDCVGEWGAEVSVELPDGSIVSERARFNVQPLGSTPAIGAAAPRSQSPTALTDQDVQRISTDQHPYPAAYDKTVADTVTSGLPSLVFFATPAFCQSGYCGPTVELVKGVAREYEGQLEFVNVEPYELDMTENGLQPRLSEDGQLQPVEAARDYGIPVEPYLFLVDAQGDVFAKFEVIVGGEELRAAVEDVLGAEHALG